MCFKGRTGEGDNRKVAHLAISECSACELPISTPSRTGGSAGPLWTAYRTMSAPATQLHAILDMRAAV